MACRCLTDDEENGARVRTNVLRRAKQPPKDLHEVFDALAAIGQQGEVIDDHDDNAALPPLPRSVER